MPEQVRRFLGVTVERWRWLLKFLLARAAEPGSVRQMVVMGCALVGLRIAPERAEAIGWAAMAVAVVIGILTREEHPPPPPPEGQA